jgi:hypothetical protein
MFHVTFFVTEVLRASDSDCAEAKSFFNISFSIGNPNVGFLASTSMEKEK